MTPTTERLAEIKLPGVVDRAAGRGSAQEIMNIAATAEAFSVTLLGMALQKAASGELALNTEQQQALRAAQAQEQEHFTPT